MAHCPYEKIKNLEPVFAQIRKLDKIKEPKPGIFYLKSQGFLHFHIKEDRIWAHIKNGNVWSADIDIPTKVTAAFLKRFFQQVKKSHQANLT